MQKYDISVNCSAGGIVSRSGVYHINTLGNSLMPLNTFSDGVTQTNLRFITVGCVCEKIIAE